MKPFRTFLKLPTNRSFSYEPRFYDPIKEDIDNRRALIASSLRRQKKLNLGQEDDFGHHSRISMAFQRKERMEKRSFLTQLFIVIILLLLFGAFLI